jgi:transposase
MQAITTVGLDIAKSVFQVHRVDAAGQVVIRRQLKRRHVLPFFVDLGEQGLKNIAGPVRAYRVQLGGSVVPALPALALPEKPSIAVLPFVNMSPVSETTGGDRSPRHWDVRTILAAHARSYGP